MAGLKTITGTSPALGPPGFLHPVAHVLCSGVPSPWPQTYIGLGGLL